MRQAAHIALITAVALMTSASARAEDSARIYVYAQRETPARSWLPISCDGTVVAKLKRGRFFAITVTPGRHTLSDEKGVPVVVKARSGKDSFVRLEWLNGDVGGPSLPVLQVVSPGQAHDDMLSLAYVDASKVLAKSVPKADPRKPLPLMRRSETDDE